MLKGLANQCFVWNYMTLVYSTRTVRMNSSLGFVFSVATQVRAPEAHEMAQNIVETLLTSGQRFPSLSRAIRPKKSCFFYSKITHNQAAKIFTTAIVTGRSKDKVYDFVQLDDVFYAGSHGLEIQGPQEKPFKCQVSHFLFLVVIFLGLSWCVLSFFLVV